MNEKRIVAFIEAETGDDLIVGFALQDIEEPSEVQSLTLIRTPKFEFLVEDDERGVSIGLEGDDEDEDDYLVSFDYVELEKVIRIKTRLRQHELDVRKVDGKELKQMKQALRRMNFDNRFTTSGV